VTPSGRISRSSILDQLKRAARQGDRVALAAATQQMKIWALSPRYWQKYLDLLTHPLARLVDLTVIKQGDKIARQKGWVTARQEPRRTRSGDRQSVTRARRPTDGGRGISCQPLLFPDQGD